jgi:Na+/H+-dicarboxylate symporter/ABC-type amino acid transport substrate-binding protein
VTVIGLPSAQRGLRAVSLPAWILIGAVAGILTGVVFGERTGILQPIGEAYARMLEMAVYPYILCSLLHSLGRLTPGMARRLLASGWGVYVFLWAVTLGSIRLLALAIPPSPLPSVLTAETVRPQADFLSLLIPDNVISALGQNYVPAVVVFAIFYGVAIQKVEARYKEGFFPVLQTLQTASVTIWNWIVRAAPLGVFALMAVAAGSIEPADLGGVLLYIGLFLIGAFLLAFVLLPFALAAIAPISYREILKEMQPALILALVTTLSVVALPYVMKAAERVTALAGCPDSDERKDILQANLSLSYVLAQLGNYFIYLLILYAAYAYRAHPTPSEKLLLPLWTLLSGFGSPTATVDGVKFLSGWLGLPPDVLNLFLATWPVTRYGQVALSVMAFGFVNILVPLIYFRKTRPRVLPAAAAGGLTAGLLAAVIVGGIALRHALIAEAGNPQRSFDLDPALAKGVKVTLHREPAATADAPAPTGYAVSLSAIQASGVLRVGYNPNIIPFTYWNDRDQLVGFDVSYAYELARDLDVGLEFIPFEWQDLASDLKGSRFDIAMAGIYVTDDRLEALTVSKSYYQSPVALIVRSERARDFLSRSAVLAIPHLRLAVFDDPVLLPLVRHLFPVASIELVRDYSVLPGMADRFDAAIWTLQQAGAWAASHPGFTAVAPSGMGSPLLFAYLLPPGADSFRQFLDQWLELHAGNGFRDEQVSYWIDGRPRAGEHRPRWNLFDALRAGTLR